MINDHQTRNDSFCAGLHQKQWYPLAQLENVLLLDSTDYAESLCREYGLHVGPMPGSGDLGVYFDSNQVRENGFTVILC